MDSFCTNFKCQVTRKFLDFSDLVIYNANRRKNEMTDSYFYDNNISLTEGCLVYNYRSLL